MPHHFQRSAPAYWRRRHQSTGSRSRQPHTFPRGAGISLPPTLSPAAGSPREPYTSIRALERPSGPFLERSDSTLVGRMQGRSSTPTHIFIIDLKQTEFNELPMARPLPELWVHSMRNCTCGQRSHQFYSATAADPCRALCQQLAAPTFLLSRLAQQDVTTAISSYDGDELFSGYFLASRRLRTEKACPTAGPCATNVRISAAG